MILFSSAALTCPNSSLCFLCIDLHVYFLGFWSTTFALRNVRTKYLKVGRKCQKTKMQIFQNSNFQVLKSSHVSGLFVAPSTGHQEFQVLEPAQEAGIFARVACSGVVDPELANYAVQVLGMGKERKEFVVHLCTPQEPGRCQETGAALHCEEWAVVPGEAGRGAHGESAVRSAKTGSGLRPEIAEAGPALFGPVDGERLGAQVAALANELGLDPLARPIE